MGKGITRREVIARIGAAMAGAVVAPHIAAEPAANAEGSHSRKKAAKQQPSKRPTGKPNVLWITTEGVPLSMLGCYGSRLMATPHIDRIAHEGMRFTNSFCTNALCAPSRAALLTGKYSHLNGMFANPADTTYGVTADSQFSEEQETLPKILKRNGYQTGIVGKWHLPANPGKVGFDYYVYKNGAGGPYYEEEHYFRNRTLGSDVTEEVNIPGYVTDNVIDLTIEAIQSFTQPFFMAVQFFSVHRPFQPPHKYEHLFDGVRIPEPGTFYDDYSSRAAAAREARMRVSEMPDFHPPAELTEKQRKQSNYQMFMSHFLSTLRAQDDNMGRLLDFLDEKGLTENTIVIFTGDHGFFMGDHGWFDKRFMYEQAIRVPWMIRYPGHVKPGTVSDDWVVNIDNAPTVLDLLGLPVPPEMQGRSIAPLLTGKAPDDWQKSYYYHYYEFAPPHWVFPHYGIRTEKYKLIHYYTVNEWELFDLEKDPDEMENLWEWSGFKVHPGYEEVAADLVNQLQALREKYKDNTGTAPKIWPRGASD
jgi:arylsulfatase A-like enzyme